MSPSHLLLKRLPIALLLLMTPAYYLAPWTQLGGRGESLGFVFVLAYTVYLPGHVINRALGRRSYDALTDFTASWLYGLAFMLAMMFVWTISGMSLATVTRFLPAAIAVVTIVGALYRRPLQDDTPTASVGAPPFILTALLVVLSVIILRVGVPLNFTSDTIDHVGYVKEIHETGLPFPTEAFYKDAGEDGEDIRKGFMHSFYGFASAYVGMEPLRFINTINMVMAMLLLLTVYSVALHWFKDGWVGLLAAIIVAFGVTGGLSLLLIRVAYFPSRFGIVFFLFLLVAALDYLWHRRAAEWPRLALFAFAACATHVFFGLLIGCFGVLLLVWKNCFALNSRIQHYRSVVVIGVWIALGAVPVCVFRYLTDFPEANDLHTELQGVLLLGPLFIAEPGMLFRWLGPLGLAAIASTVPLWQRKGTHPALGYMVASGLTIPLVLLNPLLLPVLNKAMTYLTFRIALLFPFYILTAFYLVGYIRERYGQRDGYERLITLGAGNRFVAALLALAFALHIPPGVKAVASWPGAFEHEASQSHSLWSDGLEFLANEVPPGSVIATDPLTGYTIPAFSSSYVVCALDQHVPPNDRLLTTRIRAARDILSPFVSMQRTQQLLDENDVDYVVVNNRFGSTLLHYWTMDDDIFADCINKFDTFPDLFERVYDREDFVVYGRRGQSTTNEAIIPKPWRIDELPADYRVIDRDAGVARLEAGRVRAGTLPAGGTLDIGAVWSIDRPLELDNYVVSVRFDRVGLPLPFNGAPFPKVSRKIKEKITGELYRFRADHKIVGGFLSPDVWEVGELISEHTTVALPSNLSRGEYTVQLKLHRIPHVPVHTVHDYLYDDDVFAGVEIGRITIE